MAANPLEETPLPYAHLLTHPTRALTLVYTSEAEAAHVAEGYVVVPIDTRQISLIFRPAMQLRVCHG